MTANMWLTALTAANKMISEISGTLIGDRAMLSALISAENKLRDALNSGLNPVNAFGEAVKAVETFAMQTVQMSGSCCIDSINCTHKVLFDCITYTFCIHRMYIFKLNLRQNNNLYMLCRHLNIPIPEHMLWAYG